MLGKSRGRGRRFAMDDAVNEFGVVPKRMIARQLLENGGAHVFRPEISVTGRLVPAPQQVAGPAPMPAAPPATLTGEGDIGAEQDSHD